MYGVKPDVDTVSLSTLIIALVPYSAFNMLKTSLQTVFMAVMEDDEKNGTGERPYYMSNKMKSLLLQEQLS